MGRGIANGIWSYHTTPHSSTHETPFRMVYGSNAMIPNEVMEQRARVLFAQAEGNDSKLLNNLDFQEEVRARAQLKEEACKRRAAWRYDSKVRRRSLKQGDLVLRKRPGVEQPGKLHAHWEGPFRVKAEVGKGAYRFERLDGKKVPCTWNATNLRYYYS